MRQAAGLPVLSFERSGGAVGVMMIPIPRAGLLREINGVEEAASVEGIEGIEITAKLNYPIEPLPEGASYLGFIFARAESPETVEEALREAHRRLDFRIAPMILMGGLS
ncbi:hypothetical protein BH23CHL2_BH23CHL2_22270 [soil metagenome]